MRWIDAMKKTISMSLQELSRAIKDRTLWTSFIELPGVGAMTQWNVITISSVECECTENGGLYWTESWRDSAQKVFKESWSCYLHRFMPEMFLKIFISTHDCTSIIK